MYKIAQAPTVLELTMEELVSRNNPIAKQKNNSKKTKSSSGKSSSNICQKYYTDYDCSSSYGSSAVPTKLSLPSAIDQRLYPLQKEGVNWMHGLFLANCGGILGDDMGLGKTFQVTSLLVGLLLQNKVQNVLIISPVSVTASWMKELDEHLLSHVHSTKTVLINSELSKDKRRRLLDKAFANSYNSNKRTIVVSSYELVANMVDGFAGNDRLWDYVVLDEGHTIKNANTKKCKAMNELRCKHKLLLTGTPIQNNLKEFWTIINWVTDGKLFGSLSQFQEQFEGPIVSGQDPNVPVDKQKVSTEAVKLLMRLMKPILLQRKKSEHAKILKLQQKMEMTMWIPLSERQRDLYQNYLNSLDFHFTINRTGYPVEAVNYLKTVCRHPFLLEATAKKKEAKERKGSDCDNIDKLISQLADIGLEDSEENDSSYHLGKTVFDIANRKPMVDELLRDSVKLKVLIELTQRLCNAKHRLLIFSQSKLMLDIIEESLQEKNLSSCRIDGSIAGRDRQVIIDKFNLGRDGIDICLLTTKACNCGVTLTGADRVIIYDPSWNPAEDRQAVDRAFRIGQAKDVVVYRMIMASTVEEKIYEKQVFKDGLRVVTEFGKSSKYFSNKETKDLFRLGPKNRSIVLEKLWKCSSDQLEIREFADTQGELREVLGYSRHDNLYDEQELPPRQDKTKSLMENKSPNGDKNQSRIALQDLSINKLNGQKVPAENPLTLTVAPIFKSYKRKPVVDNFSPDSTSGGTSLEGSNRRPVVITISDDEDDEVCRTYESNKELSTEPVSEICDPEETSNSIEGSVDSLGDQDSFSEDDDDSDDLKSFIDDGPLIYYNDSHSDLPCQDEVIDLVSDDEKAQSDNVNYGNNLVDLTMDQTSLELSAVVKNGLNNLPDSDACLSVNFEDNITFTDDLCSSHTSNPPNDHDDRSCMISETASGIDCIDNPRVELEISLNQHEKLLSVNNSKLQEYDDSECYDDEYNEGCPELAQLNNLVQFSKRSSTYLESVSLQDSIEKHIQSVSTEISCDNFAGNNPQEVSSQDEESQDSSNPIVIGKLVNGTSPTVFLEKFAVPDLFSPGTTVKSLVHSTSNYSIAYDNQVSVIAGMTDLLSENLPQETPKDASYFVNNEQSYYDRVFVLAASTSKPCNTGTAARPSRRSSFLSGFVYCDSSQDSSCISQSEDQKDTIQRNIFSSDARRSVCSYRSSLLEDGHSPTKNDKERGSTLDLTARTLSPSVKQTDDVANELSVTTFDNSIEDLVNATKNIDLGEEKGGDWFIDKSNFRTSVDREFLSDKYCSQEDAILSPILLSNHCRRSENFMDMSTNHGNDSIRYSL